MIHIKFKNLERSEMAREAVHDRLASLVEKFPDLSESRLQVTLEVENSPKQSGPDVFKVKLFIARGRYDGITVEKSHSNIYVALADIVDHMLERLNRAGDRTRVKQRNAARSMARALEDRERNQEMETDR